MHASIVLSQDAVEYAALFAEIADAYFEREMYAEAGRIYEKLGADATVSHLHIRHDIHRHEYPSWIRRVVCKCCCKQLLVAEW